MEPDNLAPAGSMLYPQACVSCIGHSVAILRKASASASACACIVYTSRSRASADTGMSDEAGVSDGAADAAAARLQL